MKQAIIDFLTDQKILILGYAREGRSALDFVRTNLPNATVAVADQAQLDLDVPTICGDDYLKACDDYDIIIKSPGVIIRDYISDQNKAKITSLTDLFLRFCPNPIVGITGTKGKSTTASLIYHILHTCGHNTVLCGNIGTPCFDVMDQLQVDTIVVFEMSCHQLEFIQASPHVAVLLNLYDEHFDHYTRPEDYFTAKKNIFRYQNPNDYLVYGDIFQHASREEIQHAAAENQYDLYHDEHILPEKIQTNLLGEHNLYDIYAAIYVCKEAFGLTEEEILKAITSFQGLPHRLEYVGKFNKIKFYNSSIATAQEATIGNIKALGDSVDTIILGGMDRGLDYHVLVEFIRTSTIRNVLLLPDTEQSFQRVFNEAPFSQNLIFCQDLPTAVETAYKVTAEDHICLLSPAAASYGFYKNFEERGDHFKQLVKEYNKK